MDEIIKKITTKYDEEAKQLMVPVDAIQGKIATLEKGIASINETFDNAKNKVKQLDRDISKAISETYDEHVIDRTLNESVTAKLKLETIINALQEATSNLDTLKKQKTSLLQDRADLLRQLIADSYGDFQALFFTYIEQVHKLAITWNLLGERLADQFDIKYGKTVVVQDPIAPLSFGKFGADLKAIIQGTGAWETEHLGKSS